MSDPNQTAPADTDLARRVRDAADALNAAVDAAHEAGIAVNFGVTSWAGRIGKAHVVNIWIERPARWSEGIAGVKL